MQESNSYFITQTLRKYLFPTIISILGTTLAGFVNSLYVGNILGSDALAAVNLMQPFTFLFAMLGCLFAIGASARASVAMGHDENEKVGSYMSLALWASIVIPLVIALLSLLFFRPILNMFGAGASMYKMVEGYGRIVVLTGFLTTLMYFPFNFLRLDGRSSRAMLVFGLMAGLDIILVPLFLHFSKTLASVALGLAIATAAADACGMWILLKGRGASLKLSPLRGDWKRHLKLMPEIVRAGSPAALNNLCNMLRTILMNSLILKALGTRGAAEFAIVCSIINFTAATVSGSGQTVTPLAGVFYGERDQTSLRILVKAASKASIQIHLVLLALSIPTASWIVRLFGVTDPSIMGVAKYAVIWTFASLIPAAVLNVFIYYYMTLEHTLVSLSLTFFRALLFVVVFTAILLRIPGIVSTGTLMVAGEHALSANQPSDFMQSLVFLSFLMGELATLAAMPLLCRICRLRHRELRGLLLLPDEALMDGNFISFSVPGTHEGAAQASEKTAEFCETHDVSMKIAGMLPLALEEMLVIISDHCLMGDAKKFSDIRIVLVDQDLILRIRCGGQLFDPVAWYEHKIAKYTPEEMLMDESMGMKIIVKKTKNVQFRRTFGMNNLIIRF